MNKDILAYVRSAKEHKMTDLEIRQNLHNAGWEAGDIEDAMVAYASSEGMADQVLSAATKPQVIENVVSLEPAHQAEAVSQKKSVKKVVLTVVFVILLLGVGGFTYVFGYNTPAQVWSKFLQIKQAEIFNTKFSLTYKDDTNGSATTTDSILGLKNIFLKFDGNVYLNSADKNNSESTADVQYSFGSGDTNFNTGFKYRLKGDVIYVNIGSNPFLDMLTESLSLNGQPKPEWLKIDTKALKENSAQNSQSLESFSSVFTPELSSQINEIWKNARILKMKKFKGFEKVSGVMTMHFENELDKEAFKSVIMASVQKLADAAKNDASTSPEEIQSGLDAVKKIVNGIVDKISVKDFETWIGVKNFNMYKVKFSSNAPSVLAAIAGFSVSGDSDSRDTKRYTDMLQLSSALEQYSAENGGFPESLEGKPVGLEPDYIYLVPTAPETSDGACSSYYNTYWYAPQGEKKTIKGKVVYTDYSYDFCLGSSVGGHVSGIAKMTSKGIQSGLKCDSKDPNCKVLDNSVAEAEKVRDEIDDVLEKMNFGAEFSVDAVYENYGQIRAIEEPKEFYDLTRVLKGQQDFGQ